MKKLLLLIVSIVSVTYAYAQSVDSMQVQSTTTIDSLSVRLDRLQHDYNFLYCDYELHKLMYDLSDFSNSTDISANRTVTDFYNGEYNSTLYSKSLEEYNSKCFYLDSIKKKIEAVKLLVLTKMIVSDFSEQEQAVIYAGFDVIQKHLKTAENSLSYYDIALQAYNSRSGRRR